MWDLWAILGFLYNCILIIFIAAHLLVGALICFGAGVYCGIYLCQNYEVPRIDEPYKLWESFVKYLERYRKGTRGSPAVVVTELSEQVHPTRESEIFRNTNYALKSS